MPSGTRATRSAEAAPATASVTAATRTSNLITRAYLRRPNASTCPLGSAPGVAFERRSEMELCTTIDEARRRWDVLKHPFYERWECGELTRDELAFYAGEYRHAVVALARAAAATGDGEHAQEEAEHVALWDEFAAVIEAPLDREPTR